MEKDLAVNRKAYHDYFIEDEYEAGIELKGTEIKSVRQGKIQLKDSYVSFIHGEAFVKGMNISQYDHGNRFNHEEDRERKLLLHKHEILKLYSKVKMQGYAVIPLKVYLSKGRAKVLIALAKGKNLHDKRESDKVRTMERQAKAMVNR